MSDIAIRFDGVLLAACLALAASIYLVIALAASILWLRTGRTHYRSREVARTSALFGALYVTGLAILLAHLIGAPPPVTGPDWLDWFSLPSMVLFVIGCVIIAHRRGAPQ
jgi:cytochrome bd-type quinol oxidase subunit 2